MHMWHKTQNSLAKDSLSTDSQRPLRPLTKSCYPSLPKEPKKNRKSDLEAVLRPLAEAENLPCSFGGQRANEGRRDWGAPSS